MKFYLMIQNPNTNLDVVQSRSFSQTNNHFWVKNIKNCIFVDIFIILLEFSIVSSNNKQTNHKAIKYQRIPLRPKQTYRK